MEESNEILIEEIINDVLDTLADWKKPVALQSVGPKFPELADQFMEDILRIKQSLRDMLQTQTVETLISHYQNNNYLALASCHRLGREQPDET